jgi:starch phosphorylase
MYYTLSDDRIPHMWVKKMKETIRSTASRFSAKRMLKEYVRMGYDPALQCAAKYKSERIQQK